MIPYGKQSVDEADIAAVVAALRSDWLTQGPLVDRFEAALAARCGAKHAVAVANGTIALHLACIAAGVGPGDEGITSSITFLASANCLLYCGATPVFVDIDGATWNLDPVKVAEAITPKTRVLIPVHFAGLPCDLADLRTIARERGLVVIEDACHALGATYHGMPIGLADSADMVCFSFHPVKHITTAEGGAVLTNNDEYAARLRQLRHHGITKEPSRLEREDGPWYYEAHELGFNGRLTDVQCALGLSQLRKLDGFLERRSEIAAHYREGLSGVRGLRLQQIPDDRTHAFHLFVAHIDPGVADRGWIFEQLRTRGIAPQVHYVPVHAQPLMRRLGRTSGPMTETERYYAGCLSLPMYPSLSEREQEQVIEALRTLMGAA